MTQDITKRLRNGALSAGSPLYDATNHPHTENRCERRYARETKAFYQRNLKYAGDMVRANVQGIDWDDFYRFQSIRIRVSEAVNTASGETLSNDWKRITPEDRRIEFLPVGAKVCFNGQTYLVVNPNHVESVHGTAIIRRCNATWCHMDYYGNILREPFIYGHGMNDMATGDDAEYHMILPNGYQHAAMQLSPDTESLEHNTRIILGKSCYTVRGVVDFIQEFSDEMDKTRMQYFDLHLSEPLEMDDLNEHVAGRYGLKWSIRVTGHDRMRVSEETDFTAKALRNLEESEKPTHFIWKSDDPEVVTIDREGHAKAISEGECNIVCVLEENPDVTEVYTVTVEEETEELVWVSCPESILRFESANVTCEDPQDPDAEVAYTFTGLDKAFYTAERNEDGGMTVTAYQPCDEPLVVTAICNGKTAVKEIRLKGW